MRAASGWGVGTASVTRQPTVPRRSGLSPVCSRRQVWMPPRRLPGGDPVVSGWRPVGCRRWDVCRGFGRVIGRLPVGQSGQRVTKHPLRDPFAIRCVIRLRDPSAIRCVIRPCDPLRDPCLRSAA